MSTTLLTLKRRIADKMGKYLSGTVTTGSTLSIIYDAANRFEGTNSLAEGWMEISSGPGLGLVRKIASNIAGSTAFVLYAALTASPACGNTYDIYLAPLKPDDYTQYINDALENDYPALHHRIVDESITVAANTYSYLMPSGIGNLLQVWYQQDIGITDYPFAELPKAAWDVTENLGVQTLRLDTGTQSLVTRTLRLVGIQRFTALSANTDTVELEGEQLELLMHGALYRLWEKLASSVPVGQEKRYQQNAQLARRNYETLRSRRMMKVVSSRIGSPTWETRWHRT